MMPNLFFSLLLLTTLLGPTSAMATLGEPETSIDRVRRALPRSSRLAAQRRTIGSASYSVHEIKNAGTTIKEYVNSKGTIFAVTWKGYRAPDLKTLIGKYDGELRSLQLQHQLSLRERVLPNGRTIRAKTGARSLRVESKNLVAIRSGHPRSLRGRYIDPTLKPVGVSINEIQ